MKEKKRLRFPILLKVILLGMVTAFVASTVAIVVSYNNMINRSLKDMDDNANESMQYAYDYFDPNSATSSQATSAFKTIREYVLDTYSGTDIVAETVRNAELKDFNSFEEYEKVFSAAFFNFYPYGMYMNEHYLTNFYNPYTTINQLLLYVSAYADQISYYAIKDPTNENRLIYVCDTRHNSYKQTGKFYHCPGSHYDITTSDYIYDIDKENIKGFHLDGEEHRFIEIRDNESGIEEVIGYAFIDYETSRVYAKNRGTLNNEILVLSLASLAVILVYAILSYLMFVKNINKLNKAALDISSQLEQNKPIEAIHFNIRSHDEMKSLGDSFEVMEQQIINYVDIIKLDAREKEKINAELEVASKIQLDALPKAMFDNEQVSVRAFIKPAKEVGGDFYDYFNISDNEMAVIISDVSGKGIPASLFMMKSKELIKSKLLSGVDLSVAVKEANDTLFENNDESLFVTSFIGVIDFKNEEIRYVNAGHEKPYIISNNKVIKLDGASNFVLGGVGDMEYHEEKHKFHKGDIIFMFTDGLNESINDNEEEFTYERIESTLTNSIGHSLDEYLSAMRNELADFVGDKEAFDDVTMLIARFNSNSLSLSFDKKDPSIIEEAVDAFEKAFGYIDSERKSKVGIILDELLNNLISYEEREDLVIDVNYKVKDNNIYIEIICNGHDYDPFTNKKEKYLNDFSHDIEEGGFGVTLVETLSKSAKYSYKNGHSHLKIEL